MNKIITRTTKSSKQKQYAAPALTKGLDILELMSDKFEAMSLKEIADQMGRSKGEIFRMLVALAERGYLAFDPNSDKYSITMKLFELAHRHPNVKRLTSVASPIMEKLCATVEQSCHLAILQGGHGLIVAQQNSPSGQRFGLRLGLNIPLSNTCSGHLLLGFSSQEKQERMLALQPKNLRRRFKKKELKEIKERVTSQGYELIPSSQVQGVTDIGYPIFDYSGKIAATLVIPFLEYLDGSHTVSLTAAKTFLNDAAKEISKSLGHGTDLSLDL
ncbi:MAG: IclR family transcriptional regulator [Robiginitomaculum sp.]